MIDIHSHILAGFDDGAASLDESLAIAERAVAEGVTVMIATPHVRDDYPTDPERMTAAVADLNAELESRNIPLRILPGGEIALDMLHRLDTDERRAFGLGGNPRVVLLEFPYSGWPLDLEATVSRLAGGGVRAVIAHPERSVEVQENVQRMAGLVDAGAVIQLTAGSCVGANGRGARRVAEHILRAGWPCVVAGDWHHPEGRRGMAEARSRIGGRMGEWVTRDVGAALIHGEPLPEHPSRDRPRLFGRRERR